MHHRQTADPSGRRQSTRRHVRSLALATWQSAPFGQRTPAPEHVGYQGRHGRSQQSGITESCLVKPTAVTLPAVFPPRRKGRANTAAQHREPRMVARGECPFHKVGAVLRGKAGGGQQRVG